MVAVVFGDADADHVLVPTSVKTGNYTALALDFVPCDTSGGAFTVTLPTAPPDRTRVGVSLVRTSAANTLTIAGGGATFNTDDGPSIILNRLDQSTICQYVQASNVWYTVSGSFFTGLTLTGYIAPAVVTLTDAPTITVNAASGNDFRVTLTATGRTLGNPANPVDGQRIDFQVTQDGAGSRTLSYGTAYAFAASLPAPTLTTTPGATDLLSFLYNATRGKWLFTGSVLSFS